MHQGRRNCRLRRHSRRSDGGNPRTVSLGGGQDAAEDRQLPADARARERPVARDWVRADIRSPLRFLAKTRCNAGRVRASTCGRGLGGPSAGPANHLRQGSGGQEAGHYIARGREGAPAKECAVVSKLTAEFIGTFWLVLGGCGSAVLAAAFPDVGIGLLGVSLAFGLTVLSGAYALGPISGGHFNPAVSVGLCAGGRFPAALLLPYTVAQVVGGVCGAGVLYFIASGRAGFQPCGRIRLQRLRRALTGRVFACGGAGVRSRHDVHVPGRHSRHHAQTRSDRIRRPRHRPRAHADPSDQHPGDEHLGQSGAQHRNRAVRRRLGPSTALAVLACSGDWRRNRRLRITRRSSRAQLRKLRWPDASLRSGLAFGRRQVATPHEPETALTIGRWHCSSALLRSLRPSARRASRSCRSAGIVSVEIFSSLSPSTPPTSTERPRSVSY